MFFILVFIGDQAISLITENKAIPFGCAGCVLNKLHRKAFKVESSHYEISSQTYWKIDLSMLKLDQSCKMS